MGWRLLETDVKWIRYAYYLECLPYRIAKYQRGEKWKYILWKVTGKHEAQLGVFDSADEAKEACELTNRERRRAVDA